MLRARKNEITELTDIIGVVHLEFVSMGKLTNDYFQELFSADPSLDASTVLDFLEAEVSEADN